MNRRKHNKIWASTPPLLIQHFHSITRQWTLSWKLETIITRLLWQPEEITETVFTLIFRVFSSNSEKAETSRGWFRSIDLWVMGPARFRCTTLLMLGGDARKYFSTLILSHFSNTSKFNTVTFSIFFSPFSFFICLLYAFHFLSGPYSLCHSQNIDATQSLVFSPHKSSTLSFFKRVTIIPFGSRIMIAR